MIDELQLASYAYVLSRLKNAMQITERARKQEYKKYMRIALYIESQIKLMYTDMSNFDKTKFFILYGCQLKIGDKFDTANGVGDVESVKRHPKSDFHVEVTYIIDNNPNKRIKSALGLYEYVKGLIKTDEVDVEIEKVEA